MKSVSFYTPLMILYLDTFSRTPLDPHIFSKVFKVGKLTHTFPPKHYHLHSD